MVVRERFEAKYIPVTESGCWIWIGYIDKSIRGGYGRFALNGRAKRAHRVAYELYRGEIPAGMTLDHLCRVRCCVNPDHLEVVTMDENRSRGMSPSAQHARRAHCLRGHLLTAENTWMRSDGGRRCRQCKRDASNAYTRSGKRRKRREVNIVC